MSDIKLGNIIENSEEQKDAIHIAIVPVIATELLYPGQNIGLCYPEDYESAGFVDNPIGIVDPFLKHSIHKDIRFWMLLYQNTITSLRHDWEHPSFISKSKDSEKWLKDMAAYLDIPYSQLLEDTKNYIDTGKIMFFPKLPPDEMYNNKALFWRHYENVTGVSIEDVQFFRCGC